MARDRKGRLLCPECGRPIGGITGLDEIRNMVAHLEEHHNEHLEIEEALTRRIEWERA